MLLKQNCSITPATAQQDKSDYDRKYLIESWKTKKSITTSRKKDPIVYSFPLQQTEQEEVDDAVARAKAKRASMVKKALRYFEDKSNRSMSEDNLFTRRKNLAVHLGLDENVSLREIQKINTFSLPVPSSATPFNAATGALGPR